MTEPKDSADKEALAALLSYISRSTFPARPYYAAPKATGRPPKTRRPSAENIASQKRLASLYHRKVRAPGNGKAGGVGKKAAVANQHAPIIALAKNIQSRKSFAKVRHLARAILAELARPRLSTERRPPIPSLSTIERIIRAHVIPGSGPD